MLQKRKIPFDILDSIRGIASLYVAIAHCRGILWIGGSEFLKKFPRDTWDIGDYLMFGTSMLTRLAVEFVIVFFVLSGFSIAHSLSSDKSALQFYKRRFIRIYPSYLIALVWAGAVFLLTKYWHPEWYNGETIKTAIDAGISPGNIGFIRSDEMNTYFNGSQVLQNIFYLPGRGYITPFWSLTYEVIFYLLAPFLLRKINLYAGISAVLFLANFIVPGKIQSLNLPVPVTEFLFVYNIYFVAGILLYTHYEKVKTLVAGLSQRQMIGLLLFIVFVMYGVNFYFRVETAWSFIVSGCLGITLILYFLKYEVRIPWLMSVGRYSYTLYITHFASIFLYLGLYWLIAEPDQPYILNYFIWMPAVLFVMGIAWIQYMLVEKRTKNILNILRGKAKSGSR
jgi:peptidoglycan/LPS O-acetylase OafA/YrhL